MTDADARAVRALLEAMGNGDTSPEDYMEGIESLDRVLAEVTALREALADGLYEIASNYLAGSPALTPVTVWTCMSCGTIGDRQSCASCYGEALPGRWVPAPEEGAEGAPRCRHGILFSVHCKQCQAMGYCACVECEEGAGR